MEMRKCNVSKFKKFREEFCCMERSRTGVEMCMIHEEDIKIGEEGFVWK